MVADEAAQGIDPAALEKSLENSFDSRVAGKNPDHTDSIYGAGFDKPAINQPYPGQISVARPMG